MDRKRQLEEQVVELIFGVEEGPRGHTVRTGALRGRAHVAARAKTAAIGMVEQHQFDRWIPRPPDQLVRHATELPGAGSALPLRRLSLAR